MSSHISFFSNPERVVADYFNNGFHIEYGLLTDQECADIKVLASELSDPKQGEFSPVMMPHRENPTFLRFMANPKVVAIMKAFLQGEISGLQSQYFFSPPGTKGFTYHQDNYFVKAELGAFASAWFALEDTSAENGGLIALPGSHREGDLPVRETNINSHSVQDPNAYRVETIIPPSYDDPVNLVVPKGAVLFIHGNLVHASNNNTHESRTRQVLLNTYIRKGENFRAGYNANRVEIDLWK